MAGFSIPKRPAQPPPRSIVVTQTARAKTTASCAATRSTAMTDPPSVVSWTRAGRRATQANNAKHRVKERRATRGEALPKV